MKLTPITESIRHAQGSPEWLAARANSVSATDVSVIEGVNAFKNVEQLTREKIRALETVATGRDHNEFQMNDAVMHGQITEPIAKSWYEKEFGVQIVDTGFVKHREHGWLGASPDGLIGVNCAIEVKCPYWAKQPYSVFDKPHYLSQCMAIMECLDIEEIVFLCYFHRRPTDRLRTLVEVVHRDPNWLDEELKGSLLPVSRKGTVRRIDLLHEWFNHWMNINQDPVLRQPHIEDAKPDIKMVKDDDDLNKLARIQDRQVSIEMEIEEQLESLDICQRQSNELKKSIAEKYEHSVSNGSVDVVVTNKRAPVNFKKAYEFLGGDKALESKGENIDSFRGEGTRQISIRKSGSE